MGWFLLALAIVLEVAGTTCMKLSGGFKEMVPSVLVFVFYGFSFTAFIYALKTIDLSITYAIWAGLGLALIAAISILYFKEPVTVQRMVFMGLILIGVIGLSLNAVKG
ncbi:MAG: multidrug efflux SMR transporter [Dehalococcoidia bacterium]|nr:MAG: multidrug efflux SMR transporter [Dehalococcoidia bacterium]